MIKTVIPGVRLELLARLELRGALVFDRESGEEINLADLLRSFQPDSADSSVGEVRVTIEPAPVRLLPGTPDPRD